MGRKLRRAGDEKIVEKEENFPKEEKKQKVLCSLGGVYKKGLERKNGSRN